MKNKAVLIILAMVVIAAAAVVLRDRGNSEVEQPNNQGGAEKYESAEYGFSFSYPPQYVVDVREIGSAARRHTNISLITKEDKAALDRGERSEGPVAITFDVFQNNLDQQPIESFVTGTNDSNYKLPPDDPYSSTTVAGKPALTYRWEGLYNGESFVFSHNGNIIMASVSYFSSDDSIRSDFMSVLSSLSFAAPEPISESEALELVKGIYPELSNYPSEDLPPTQVNSERAPDRWYLSFEVHGSGVPYIIEASCFQVTDSREVTRVGTYKHSGAGTGILSARTCTPVTSS